MPIVPWRIAEQSYTILNADKEPIVTLSFTVNHNAADVQRLRITPQDINEPALELQFANGGFVIEDATAVQPRWLKPFERPEPNLHLDNDGAWEEYAEGLGEDQRASMQRQRDEYLKRRDEFQRVRSREGEAPDQAFDRVYGSGDPLDQPFYEHERAAAEQQYGGADDGRQPARDGG